VVPKKTDLLAALHERKRRLEREINRRFSREADRLNRAQADIARLSPLGQLARREQAVRELRRRMHAALKLRLSVGQASLTATGGRERIQRLLANRFADQARRLESQRRRLVALNPDSVLSRGYSITRDAATGAILRSATEARVDEGISIQLGSGKLAARVEEVEA